MNGAVVLDVRRLRLLRELQLRGTIAAVADALNYAPSAVSQQLSTLEREVGVPLTRRSGRRLQLTPQAELLAGHAAIVLEHLEQAERELAASLDRATGSVRIAVFQSAALALVPRMLQLLEESSPQVRIELVQREPETALYDTHVGDFDLVVAEQYPGHVAPLHPSLDREVLMTDALRLAVPQGTDIAGIEDAGSWAWTLEPIGAASRHWVEQLCRSHGFEPDVRFSTADMQAQIRLIETGFAVGVVNSLTWTGTAPTARLIDLPGAPHRVIFTSTRRAAIASPEIVAVRAALAQAVPDEAA